MLARLAHTLRHLFTPHQSNNHRPRLLHPSSLAVLTGLVLLANSSVRVFALVRGGVLGYASDITVQEVLQQTNARRADAGIPPLVLDQELVEAAQGKAADMFAFDYWAHVNPVNGTEPWHFFDTVNYKYRYAGENLARDFSVTPVMVQAWIDSPSHRENLLSRQYQDTGIAVLNGTLQGVETTLVVQLFGTRQNPAAVPRVSASNTSSENSENSEGRIAEQAEIQKAGNSEIPALQQSDLSGSPSLSSILKTTTPVFSPLDISKSIALSTLILITMVILIDSFLVWRRRTHRLAGHNWAHLLFITGLIILIGSLQTGLIK